MADMEQDPMCADRAVPVCMIECRAAHKQNSDYARVSVPCGHSYFRLTTTCFAKRENAAEFAPATARTRL